MKKIIGFSFIGLLGLLLTYLYISAKNNYKLYEVQEKEVVDSVYSSGYIDSVHSVVVKSQVSGYIEKILVRENQNIKKGQTLAIISNPTLTDNLREITAQKEFIMERLKEDSPFLKELRDSIEIKRINLENLKSVYERRKRLFEKGLISRESFEEVEKNLEIAKRDYDRQVKIFEDTVESLKSQLNSLKARKDSIQSEVKKHTINSPLYGLVLRKFVNEGDYINSMTASNQLFLIGDPQKLETVLNVDEEYIPLLKEGQKVLVILDSYPEDVFEGKIKLIESAVDRNNRTVKVKAEINYHKPVSLGMVVEANIIIGSRRALFIPSNSYKDGYVEVLQNGRIERQPVKVGQKSYDGLLEVKEGLSKGQKVVVR